MILSKESVDAHKKLMLHPKEHGMPFRPLQDCFIVTEKATPKHLLFKDFQREIPQLQKVFFYIIMDEVYADKIGKADNGDFGYFLEFIPNEAEPQKN